MARLKPALQTQKLGAAILVAWRAGVAHLRCSGVFLFFSRPLRAGLTYAASPALDCAGLHEQRITQHLVGAGCLGKAAAEPPHSKGSRD